MQKLRVMTIVGTRPEIIRLSRIIPKIDLYCEHTLVHTGQNYDFELNEVFFTELGIRKPDIFLNAVGASTAETIGKIISLIDDALLKYNPDAVFLLGDTNSSLSAIAVKRRKIPIFHMEAGNRCYDFRVPEEINRRIVDHISDVNLTYSKIAREYLLREGLPPDQIINIGSPMREVIEFHRTQFMKSKILRELELTKNSYFLVSSHREENVDSPENLTSLYRILNGLAERFNQPVIVSTHPRTRKRIDEMGLVANPLVKFLKPFGFFDYVQLQISSRAVLSDSGTITEESSILNFPALNLREVHERPEGFEEAAVMFVGLNVNRVFQALTILEEQLRGATRSIEMVDDYQTTNVSEKVLRILVSYTDFVNRKVWKK